jgi:hypothetical protein
MTLPVLRLQSLCDKTINGAVDGMRTSGGNLSTRREPASLPFCPLQVSHELDLIRNTYVRSWRLPPELLPGLWPTHISYTAQVGYVFFSCYLDTTRVAYGLPINNVANFCMWSSHVTSTLHELHTAFQLTTLQTSVCDRLMLPRHYTSCIWPYN